MFWRNKQRRKKCQHWSFRCYCNLLRWYACQDWYKGSWSSREINFLVNLVQKRGSDPCKFLTCTSCWQVAVWDFIFHESGAKPQKQSFSLAYLVWKVTTRRDLNQLPLYLCLRHNMRQPPRYISKMANHESRLHRTDSFSIQAIISFISTWSHVKGEWLSDWIWMFKLAPNQMSSWWWSSS